MTKNTKQKRKFTFMEMFVGAGGSHLGFKNQGDFKTILVSDINKDMCQTFEYNNPNVPHVLCKDIHDLSGKKIMNMTRIKTGELDVIFGGIVCKGFSLAGVRSPTDPRNDLYKSYISLIKKLQPKIAIIENVPGMTSMKILDGINTSQKKKKEIKEAWEKLRKLNGLKSSVRKGTATNQQKKEVKNIEKDKVHYRKMIKEGSRTIIDDIIRLYKKAGYLVLKPQILNAADYGAATSRRRLIIIAIRKDLSRLNFLWPKKNNKRITVGDILKTIDSSKKDKDNEPMNHVSKSVRRFSYIPEGKNIVSVMNKIPKSLKISKFYSRGCTMRLDRNKPAPTLVPGHSNFPIHPKENRSITVREAAAIMGFPLNYKFFGSHTTRCEQVGQAVVVKMAEKIAESVSKFLKEVD